MMSPDPDHFVTRGGRSIELRQAEPDDAAAILAYLRRVGAETSYLTFGGEGIERTEAEERETIARFRDRPEALFLIARDDDGVIAALSFEGGERPRTRHVGEVGMSVAAAYHGEGIGRRMLEMLLAWARAGGIVRKVNLRVRVDNARALGLYESVGFRMEGRRSRDLYVDDAYHDVFTMGLEL